MGIRHTPTTPRRPALFLLFLHLFPSPAKFRVASNGSFFPAHGFLFVVWVSEGVSWGVNCALVIELVIRMSCEDELRGGGGGGRGY